MQSVKCCNLDEQYKSVCFKDLEDYQKKYDYMAGYSELEQEQIRKNLGIVDPSCVDPYLSPTSKNPVENNVIFAALLGKIDIDKVSKVAFTGNYEDLGNKPMFLPNPKALIIKGKNDTGIDDQWVYDGSYPSVVNLPTKVSQLENDKGFVKLNEVDEQIPIKTISVNHEVITPDYTKNVNINIPTLANMGVLIDEYLYRNRKMQTVQVEQLCTAGVPIAKVIIDGEEINIVSPTTNNQGYNPYTELSCGVRPASYHSSSQYGNTIFTAGNGEINGASSNIFMITDNGVYVKDQNPERNGEYVSLQEIIDFMRQMQASNSQIPQDN